MKTEDWKAGNDGFLYDELNPAEEKLLRRNCSKPRAQRRFVRLFRGVKIYW